MDTEEQNNDHLQAAEYVLGMLETHDRVRFEQALAQDPALRADVAYWEDQLAEFGLALPSITPPASVWRGIKMQTGVRSAAGGGCSRRVRRWVPWASAAAVSAVAIAMAVFIANAPGDRNTASTQVAGAALSERAPAASAAAATEREAPEQFFNNDHAIAWNSAKQSSPISDRKDQSVVLSPDFVGKLQDYASSVGWRVAGYNKSGSLNVVATGRPYTQLWEPATLELWLMPVNSYEDPISLGLLPERGERQLSIPQHIAAEFYTDYNKLAVSREPAGGSTTGEPTGDILFMTTLVRTGQ